MKFLLVTAGWVLAIVSTRRQVMRRAATTLRRSDPVLVRAVIDGDTIDVTTIGRVRLLGIDAPEIGRGFDTAAPFARDARDKLAPNSCCTGGCVSKRTATASTRTSAISHTCCAKTGYASNAVLVREGLARVTARAADCASRRAQARRGRSTGVPERHVERGAADTAIELYSAVGRRTHAVETKAPSKKRRQKPIVAAIPVEYASATQDPRAQQALLPIQPLADLDLRLLHRAGSADVRSVRARVRHAHGAVARLRCSSAQASPAFAASCRASSRGRTSSASPRIGRTRSTAASATRSPGAKSSRSPCSTSPASSSRSSPASGI